MSITNAAYTAESERQLQEWLKGNSIHNMESRVLNIVDNDGNVIDTQIIEGPECCPDFSCCMPENLWPVEKRKVFVERREVREQMLMGTLGSLLSGTMPTVKVHIAGDMPDKEH